MSGDDLMKVANLALCFGNRRINSNTCFFAKLGFGYYQVTLEIIVQRFCGGAGVAIECFCDARQQRIRESSDRRHYDYRSRSGSRRNDHGNVSESIRVFDGRAAVFHDGWFHKHVRWSSAFRRMHLSSNNSRLKAVLRTQKRASRKAYDWPLNLEKLSRRKTSAHWS